MRIVMITGEAHPFCGIGPAAGFVPALSRSLAERGHSVTICLPLYRDLRANFTEVQARAPLEVRMHDGREQARLWQASTSFPGVETLAVEGDRYFDRPGLYGEGGVHYADSVRRFAFFCRATLGALGAMGTAPDILHAHDWPAALLAVYLRAPFLGRDSAQRAVEGLVPAATILTMHDGHDRGVFPSSDFAAAGVSREAVVPPAIEVGGQVSLLREGARYADHITVPGFRSDVAEPWEAQFLGDDCGKVSRIPPGVDDSLGRPRDDPFLVAPFDVDDRRGKRRCKADLVVESQLDPDLDAPIMAVIAPLAAGHGLDLLLASLPELVSRDLRVILMGEGSAQIAANFREAARTSSGRFILCESGEKALLHKLYAGADFLLVPSEHRPSSEAVMAAQLYGALPIARTRGGFTDLSDELKPAASGGTGLWIPEPSRASLLATLDRALALFGNTEGWGRWQRRAMQSDFSWQATAEAYDRIYSSLQSEEFTA